MQANTPNTQDFSSSGSGLKARASSPSEGEGHPGTGLPYDASHNSYGQKQWDAEYYGVGSHQGHNHHGHHRAVPEHGYARGTGHGGYSNTPHGDDEYADDGYGLRPEGALHGIEHLWEKVRMWRRPLAGGCPMVRLGCAETKGHSMLSASHVLHS